MTFLVDTDWIIAGIGNSARTLALVERLREHGLAVSVVTVAEVFDGAYGWPDPAAQPVSYRRYLSGFTVLDVTEPVASVFAGTRALLRQQGNLIPDMDLLIAATALVHDLTLVTRNARHFGRVPGLTLYREP